MHAAAPQQVSCWPKAAPIQPPHMGPAYWGASAAHTRAVEVVGAVESGPKRTLGAQETVQIVGRIHSTGLIPVSLITRAQ
jgi:hypothetical protein